MTEIGRIERLELHEVFYMFEAHDGCGGTHVPGVVGWGWRRFFLSVAGGGGTKGDRECGKIVFNTTK